MYVVELCTLTMDIESIKSIIWPQHFQQYSFVLALSVFGECQYPNASIKSTTKNEQHIVYFAKNIMFNRHNLVEYFVMSAFSQQAFATFYHNIREALENLLGSSVFSASVIQCKLGRWR